jgi:hypothetical protein
MHLLDRSPLLGREVGEGLAVLVAGIVDDDVDGAELVRDGINGGLGLCMVGDVEGAGRGF